VLKSSLNVVLPADAAQVIFRSTWLELPAGRNELVFRLKATPPAKGAITLTAEDGAGGSVARSFELLDLPRDGTRLALTGVASPIKLSITAVKGETPEPSEVDLSDLWLLGEQTITELCKEPSRSFNRSVLYMFNREGFREPNDLGPRPKGVRRIAVIGDSITMGEGVHERDTFCRRLETMINAHVSTAQTGKAFEVVNLGVRGFNTAQEVDAKKVCRCSTPRTCPTRWMLERQRRRFWQRSARRPGGRILEVSKQNQ
jgi:hypothetical protein